MAPIKFEDHIREQLESRRIEPSAGSWEKLNQKLDNAPENRKTYSWLYVAAAAVVAILIVSVFFTSNQSAENTAPIVETPIEEPVIKEKPAVEMNTKEEQVVVEEEAATKEILSKPGNLAKETIIASEENAEEIMKSEQAKVEQTGQNKISEEAIVQNKAVSEKPDLDSMLINSKIEELVAEVNKQEQNGSVTDAEVNALLTQAAREISTKRNFYESGKVDADALLADVESEIDQSFRREVFEILKDGFNKARTAIVSRNY